MSSENDPIAIGAFDWENSLVDGYWTYSKDEIFAGLAAAYASMKEDVAKSTASPSRGSARSASPR